MWTTLVEKELCGALLYKESEWSTSVQRAKNEFLCVLIGQDPPPANPFSN